jgi:hypothetical protein
MRSHSLLAMLLLTCCGGIVVVDSSSGDTGEGASGSGSTGGSSGVGASGTGAADAGVDGSGGGSSDPVYCNMLEGPRPDDDGDPMTYPCQSGQECCLEQSVGWWYCKSACL